MEGSYNLKGSGIGVVIASSKEIIAKNGLCLEFLATNNEVEYEALIAGLNIPKELEVQDLKVYRNS